MPETTTLAPETEKAIQRKIYTLLISCGCYVTWNSDVRRVRTTRGATDLIAFSPLRGIAFIETKRKGGKQSPAQRAFQQACERAGGTYILADGVERVAQWLGAKVEGRT